MTYREYKKIKQVYARCKLRLRYVHPMNLQSARFNYVWAKNHKDSQELMNRNLYDDVYYRTKALALAGPKGKLP